MPQHLVAPNSPADSLLSPSTSLPPPDSCPQVRPCPCRLGSALVPRRPSGGLGVARRDSQALDCNNSREVSGSRIKGGGRGCACAVRSTGGNAAHLRVSSLLPGLCTTDEWTDGWGGCNGESAVHVGRRPGVREPSIVDLRLFLSRGSRHEALMELKRLHKAFGGHQLPVLEDQGHPPSGEPFRQRHPSGCQCRTGPLRTGVFCPFRL